MTNRRFDTIMVIPKEHILVIFGASGDLTKRKLIPALYELAKQELLPDNYAVLGVGRSELTDDAFRSKMNNALVEHDKEAKNDLLSSFLNKLYYVSFETQSPDKYNKLQQKIVSLEHELSLPQNYVYYLATPPSLYPVVPEGLSKYNLIKTGDDFKSRIIVEKPFGYDLQSARDLNNRLLSFFSEEEIYRIDHYLGKETVQNIMVTRFSNGVFEPIWNNHFIDHVEITSAESIGVENRGGYYDGAGALRDMVQNHLLQLASIIAMEAPAANTPASIRNEILNVLQSIQKYTPDQIDANVIRGQYTASDAHGIPIAGYREEQDVGPDSRTETFVALKMFINNARWRGVPFYIRTGKRMPTRVTEVVIHFKETPNKLFNFNEDQLNHDNQLIIRIQPDEGVMFKFGMKVPGAGFNVQDVFMDFHYSELVGQVVPEAYQRLLLDCLNGDSTLFARGDAVEEAWQFIDPILKYWEGNPDCMLHGYPAGSWGPDVADELIEDEHMTWRYPCKSLTSDTSFCEL